MNFNADQIRNNPFFVYEKASPSRKATGFNVFTRCAYRSWPSLTEEQKMSFIRPALRSFVIDMLRTRRVLPPGFDDVNDDPFDIAPFTAADFRPHMRKVVCHCWRQLGNEIRESWNDRASALNDRPVVGIFNQLPQRVLQGSDNNTGAALRKIIQKDYLTVRSKLDTLYRKTGNCTSTYNKVEHVYLKVPILNKFYFNEKLPYSIFSSLFGDFSHFADSELVSKPLSRNKTYHIMTRDRLEILLSFGDVNLACCTTYTHDEEVDHFLTSYARIKRSGPNVTNTISCYGMNFREHGTQIVFQFNNRNDRVILEAIFQVPVYEKVFKGIDNAGNDMFEERYSFENKQSVCRGYVIEYFCPIVLQLNPSKVNMKLIASRVSKTLHATSFNTTYFTNNNSNNMN